MAVVWVADFEQNDLKEWSSTLNAGHIQVVDSPVARGARAGRVELTNDAVWPNGLKRVELQHFPKGGRTGEGKRLYFAWSFYLPETLPASPSAQIGYWESAKTYSQMMSFEVKGEDISFSTRKPTNKVQWNGKGIVTPARWHRIAMSVLWSTNAQVGKVDVWFDGQPVVTDAVAQTKADANELFTQVGLLRGKVEFDDKPVIFIDDAVEGDSLDDVRPEPPVVATPDAGAPDASAPPPSDTPAPPGRDSGAAPASDEPDPPASADGGGCQVTGSGSHTWLAALLLIPLSRLRRRRR